MIAKAVLGLLEAGVARPRSCAPASTSAPATATTGWGAGLTVLVAMANLLPHLDADDRALALVHGLAFVARDTRGHPPRFPLDPLDDVRRRRPSVSPRGTGASSTPARRRRRAHARPPRIAPDADGARPTSRR